MFSTQKMTRFSHHAAAILQERATQVHVGRRRKLEETADRQLDSSIARRRDSVEERDVHSADVDRFRERAIGIDRPIECRRAVSGVLRDVGGRDRVGKRDVVCFDDP